MQPAELLQQHSEWRFDLRSALIGAILAWIVAGLIYSQRDAIREFVLRLWAPVAAWRRQLRASREEKYIGALKEALRRLLLLEPEAPEQVFCPPTFLAPSPLPSTIAGVGDSQRLTSVSYASLLRGHPKLVLVGPQGSGKTTAMVMAVWRATQPPDHQATERRKHLPVWVDLTHVRSVAGTSAAPGPERIVQLAAASLPGVSNSWLLQQLRKTPCLVLVDNWQRLTLTERVEVTHWITEAQAAFTDTVWIITSAEEGYGELVEQGFVPVELVPAEGRAAVHDLYTGWQALLGDDRTAADPDAATLETLEAAADAGAPLWEMHLRIALYLQTGELPARPVDVCGRWIEHQLGQINLGLGRGNADVVEAAENVALAALVDLAQLQRFEARAPGAQQMREIVERHLPPKGERPRRLESAVHKLITELSLVEHKKVWRIRHLIWTDYLAAIHLVQNEQGADMIAAHLDDPTWRILTEFYAGLTDAGVLAQALIYQADASGESEPLLRAARWAIVAEPGQPWRVNLIKVLAQNFMDRTVDQDARLQLGRALSLVAGEEARAFFLRMLRHPAPEVSRAALRGLGWTGAQRDMAVLAAALREAEMDARESAVLALRDLGTPGAAAFLAETLPKADESLMFVIARALAEVPDGWQALQDATAHPDLLVRRAAAHGLGQLDEAWAIGLLLEMAREDPEWLVRSAADTALQAQEARGDHQEGVAPPPVVDRLEWLMAWAARQGLGLGVGDAAVETLIRAAQSGNVDAKVLSALTLAQIGREADLSVLEPMRHEDDTMVRDAARWAIRRIQRRYTSYQTA